MNRQNHEHDTLFYSIYSDGTGMFRQPAEPMPGGRVSIRIRIQKGADVRISLLQGSAAVQTPMSEYKTDGMFDWYESVLYCGERTIEYSFLIEWRGRFIHYDRLGPKWVDRVPEKRSSSPFRIIPGFHVPEWSRGALQYQIFPDRFMNGDPDNDVMDREYWYTYDYIRHAPSWDALPEVDDFHCFYGGDLRGVLEKLDYIQSLGVEAIYFTPIFVSPSPHGYDTQDYDHVDPHLTLIPVDFGEVLKPGDKDNSHATRYRIRTTLPYNLEAGNEWFADFCKEIHRRGMKIILDGVFNHCGSFSRWMNKEGIYEDEAGAYGNIESAYRSYFSFLDDNSYKCWWDLKTLPKLFYEHSGELCEEVYRVAEKWASPPYSIDGWRLDVAADLGLTPEFNHRFWKGFRRRVKAVNPELVIIAEHYGDPSTWLGGDEWDTVMNYDAFMEPLSFFLTGMDKHSDYRRDDLYQDGKAFFENIFKAMSRMPTSSVYCAMDQLSNHDHSRFMTRTNGKVGRLGTAGSKAADLGIHPEVFREAALIQMTWPGAPTIYYGDEAGLTGWTDPDNRRTYPWGSEDHDLIEFFRALARLRVCLPVLRNGSIKPLCAGYGHIAYARFDDETAVIIACNNTKEPISIDLPLRDIGIPDGTGIMTRFITTRQGYDDTGFITGKTEHGMLHLKLPENSAALLCCKQRRGDICAL